MVQKKYLIKKLNSRILNKTLNSKLWRLKIKIVKKKCKLLQNSRSQIMTTLKTQINKTKKNIVTKLKKIKLWQNLKLQLWHILKPQIVKQKNWNSSCDQNSL